MFILVAMQWVSFTERVNSSAALACGTKASGVEGSDTDRLGYIKGSLLPSFRECRFHRVVSTILRTEKWAMPSDYSCMEWEVSTA